MAESQSGVGGEECGRVRPLPFAGHQRINDNDDDDDGADRQETSEEGVEFDHSADSGR